MLAFIRQNGYVLPHVAYDLDGESFFLFIRKDGYDVRMYVGKNLVAGGAASARACRGVAAAKKGSGDRARE